MRGAAGEHDDGAWRVRLQLFVVKPAWAWTSTTSGANVVRGPVPVGREVANDPDGEGLRSWT
jgi:hypothetical protein